MFKAAVTTAAMLAGVALTAGAGWAAKPSISAASIAGARLGLGAETSKQRLGSPVHSQTPPEGFQDPGNYTRLVFAKRKVDVYFKDGVDKSVQITTWNKAYRTPAGIGPCSTVAALKHAYGAKLKRSKWSTQNGKTFVYTMGDLLFASADLVTVTAVGLYDSKAPGANKAGGALPFAGFIIQAPDQVACR